VPAVLLAVDGGGTFTGAILASPAGELHTAVAAPHSATPGGAR